MDFKLISELLSTTEELIKQHNRLENIDVESIVIPDDYEAKRITDESILPHMPNLFKTARMIGIYHNNKTIMLEI